MVYLSSQRKPTITNEHTSGTVLKFYSFQISCMLSLASDRFLALLFPQPNTLIEIAVFIIIIFIYPIIPKLYIKGGGCY